MALRSCIVRAPNWVGDAVMSLGGLREVRRALGRAHLAVAARPWVAGIYEEAGVADEVIPLDEVTAEPISNPRRFPNLRAGGWFLFASRPEG